VPSIESKPQQQPAQLPTRIIDAVWQRMTEIYGHKWTSHYGTSDDSGTWAKGLADMSGAELKAGFLACLTNGEPWPPSLPEFRNLCRPPKEKRENAAAYRYTGPSLPHKISDEAKAKGRAAIAEAMRVALKA